MEKRVAFVTNNSNYNLGSYRIWIHDLNQYLLKAGVRASAPQNTSLENLEEEILIVGKGENALAEKLKSTHPNKKIGLINPEGGKEYSYCDFLIVGSVEEKASLLQNNNVFIFPLIENIFQNSSLKKHYDKKIKFCFHGHYPHLAKFEPAVREALNQFSLEKEAELLVINGHPNFNWEYGKPKIPITYKAWDASTIKEEILSCDIGLVPNLSPVTDYALEYSMDKGLYKNDYITRFKNKSNGGRAFVFHQLGIPVVADLTPSNVHVLGDPENGYIAHDKYGWLQAFRELSCPCKRNEVAENAKREFDRLYDPVQWALKLYKQIKNL